MSVDARKSALVTAPLVGEHVRALREVLDIDQAESPSGLTQDELLARIGRFDGVLTLLSHRVDAELLSRAPRLRVVANHAVGVDNIDLAACLARGVIVTNTPGVLTEATADLAFGLLADAARRITEGDRHVREHGFPRWSASLLLGRPLHGATLGIVGFGRIGRALAARARGFGMRILYFSRTRAPVEVEAELVATHVELDALLAKSDLVSLHAPLTDATRGMLDRSRLRAMKRGAILVNTARGALVDEHALAECLHDGHLGGAGLDVYAEEPRIDPLLLSAPRVVLAPHIGSADRPTRDAMARLACEGLRAVLEGREPAHRVI